MRIVLKILLCLFIGWVIAWVLSCGEPGAVAVTPAQVPVVVVAGVMWAGEVAVYAEGDGLVGVLTARGDTARAWVEDGVALHARWYIMSGSLRTRDTIAESGLVWVLP